MPETRGTVRQRKVKAETAKPAEDAPVAVVEELSTSDTEDEIVEKRKPTAAARVEDEDDYTPWVDILRVLSFLLVASCGLSYLISGGDSFFWGLRHPPKYLQTDWWKSQLRGPIRLTLDELAQYDGSDEEKPLYLAINGTIFDVSSNRRMYGPGGSYQHFAGTDAARSFVTGCFAEDRTADMRGVEDMFLPLDDPEVDSHFTSQQLEEMKKKEWETAQRKVNEGLTHWVQFFANSPKYQKVGYLVREKDWLEKEPRKKLCASAAKGRKKRKLPDAK
jgi:predicted heme/steroid binding protein